MGSLFLHGGQEHRVPQVQFGATAVEVQRTENHLAVLHFEVGELDQEREGGSNLGARQVIGAWASEHEHRVSNHGVGRGDSQFAILNVFKS